MKTIIALAVAILFAYTIAQSSSFTSQSLQRQIDFFLGNATVRAIELYTWIRDNEEFSSIEDCNALGNQLADAACEFSNAWGMKTDLCSDENYRFIQNVTVELCANALGLEFELNDTSCRGLNCPEGFSCCGSQCYDPNVQRCFTRSFLCGINDDVCGGRCFVAGTQSCNNGILCDVGERTCNNICYNPSLQTCVLDGQVCNGTNTFNCFLCPPDNLDCPRNAQQP